MTDGFANACRYAQYTPATPTRLNCRVASNRRCVHTADATQLDSWVEWASAVSLNSQLIHDRFGRQIKKWTWWEFSQSSWLQNCELGNDCRRVSTHRLTQLNSTQHVQFSIFLPNPSAVVCLSNVSYSCEFNTHRWRWRDSTVKSDSTRQLSRVGVDGVLYRRDVERGGGHTVHFDGDLAFVVASVRVHLSAACVLAVIARRDVPDSQAILFEPVPPALYNNHVMHQQPSLSPFSIHGKAVVFNKDVGSPGT